MQISTPILTAFKQLRIVVIPILVIGATTSLAVIAHLRTQQAVEEQLRERMLSTVSIAALQFDAEQIDQVRTQEDIPTTSYQLLVYKLKAIRALSPHMRFAYIMRKTINPLELAFVADADGLSSVEELDMNKNGTIDDNEQPGLPGDVYKIGNDAALHEEAFREPTVDQNVTTDKWGKLISAYAPIMDTNGEVIGVLGMDIEASEYLAVTQHTFSLLAVLLMVLVAGLLAAYIMIIIRLRNIESLKQ